MIGHSHQFILKLYVQGMRKISSKYIKNEQFPQFVYGSQINI